MLVGEFFNRHTPFSGGNDHWQSRFPVDDGGEVIDVEFLPGDLKDGLTRIIKIACHPHIKVNYTGYVTQQG